jgi:hypothetical protein
MSESKEIDEALSIMADHAKKKSEAMMKMSQMFKEGDKKTFVKYAKKNLKLVEPMDILYLLSIHDLYFMTGVIWSYWKSIFGFLDAQSKANDANLRFLIRL